MLVQKQHRFSVKDYYRMAATGVLRPDARVELLDGKIIDMSPIGPFHGGVTKYLNKLFTLAAKGRWILAVQDPVTLDDYSESQPDLMLLKSSSDYYRTQHPQPEDVLLLVEVCDSTLASDRAIKVPAYGRTGVAEVWIVNLNEATIEVYRKPHYTGYADKTILQAGDQASPEAFPDVLVDVAELLQR
jgi:Uma2 family endonuclease